MHNNRRPVNRKQRRAGERHRHAAPEPSAALVEAIGRHAAGDLRGVETAYLHELDRAPGQPDALHFLGVLRHQQQRSDEGIALVRRALAIAPDRADAWNNLGNLYKESGQLADAEASYRHALALDFDHGDAWNNLGVVLVARGEAPQAVGALRRAVECKPYMVDAYVNLGSALHQCRLLREAIAALKHAVSLAPGHVRAHRQLGRMLYLAGERDEAAAVFRHWLEADPGHPVASHMLAACTGANVPSRASDAFVRETFDVFADSFDETLLNRLDYHAPALLAASLRQALGPPEPVRAVLDAGCGTGLCAPLLRPYARTLTGVDLSSGMLRRARQRQLYDALVEDELTHCLETSPGAFDVVASADTLCYFGELATVVSAAHRSLRPAGWLAFTVERADDGDYRIQPHGRYAHSRAYLDAVLARCGFACVAIDEAVLRKENGQPVHGYVVRARAGASADGT
jgi:predicted TPR repeat methyltransferase